MRVLAPPPRSAIETEILSGYQICARCGKPLVNGDKAVVVRRLDNWNIYSHPEYCEAKGVCGWKAARYADRVRDLPNNEKETQESDPILLLGSLRPCVFLLDKKHIDAELSLVDYKPSGEIPLSNIHTGECPDVPDEGVTNNRRSRWERFDRNRIEDEIIEEIDDGRFTENTEVRRDIVWGYRARDYATGRAISEDLERRHEPLTDCAVGELPSEKPYALIGLAAQAGLVRHSDYAKFKRSRLPNANSEILMWDVKDRPVEWALYSQVKTQHLKGRACTELDCWQPNKPSPLSLPYSSRTHPQHYLFMAKETGAEPSVHGPVAYLDRKCIAKLNER